MSNYNSTLTSLFPYTISCTEAVDALDNVRAEEPLQLQQKECPICFISNNLFNYIMQILAFKDELCKCLKLKNFS